MQDHETLEMCNLVFPVKGMSLKKIQTYKRLPILETFIVKLPTWIGGKNVEIHFCLHCMYNFTISFVSFLVCVLSSTPQLLPFTQIPHTSGCFGFSPKLNTAKSLGGGVRRGARRYVKKRQWKILLKQGEEGERGEEVRKQSLSENRELNSTFPGRDGASRRQTEWKR